MHRLLRLDVDQIMEVIANRALAVFIERRREPKRAAVGQRAKAGIDVVKTRIDQLDRNDEATQEIGDGAVRIDVGAKFVAAKKDVAAEERVAFPFEIQILRQPDDFVAMLFHPAARSAALPRPVPRAGNCSG